MVTVTLLAEEPVDGEVPDEEAPVEILLQQLNEDGSVEEELKLEGVLSDARRLVLKLSAEGACVEVVIAQPEEEAAEEVPEAGEEEVAEPAESLEPTSP